MQLPRVCSLLLSFALLGASPAAFGHYGIPRAYDIYFEPENRNHIVLRSDLWGLLESRDGGRTWAWICAEAYGGNSSTSERRSLVVLPGGTVMIAAGFDGLQIAAGGDLCSFSTAPIFEDEVVQDIVATHPDGSLMHVLTSTGSAEGVSPGLWVSTDSGVSWAPTGASMPGDEAGNDFSASSLAIAPSDEARMYVAGKYVNLSADGVVQRSDDGGQTWQPSIIPVGLTSWTGRLAGVHPSNPDVVYFWMDKTETGGGDIQADQLWMSTNGAETWNQVYLATGDLPGFAFSPDGAKVAIAGPEEGLLIGPASGGGAFQRVSVDQLWGLHWDASGLYAGTNDFTAGDLPKFTFGVSTNEGQTFAGLMEICQADLIGCDGASPTAIVCESIYSEPGGWRADYIDGPRCAGGGAAGESGAAGDGGGTSEGASGGAGGTSGGAGGTSGGAGSAEIGGGVGAASAGSGRDGRGGGTDASATTGEGPAATGCGCSTPGSAPRSPGNLIALALLALRRGRGHRGRRCLRPD